MGRKKLNKRGFSLVEVLVAIVIFTIALLALVPLLFTAVNIERDSFYKVQAQAMAAEKIDELLAQDALALTDGSDPEVTINGVPFNRNWTVTPATGNLNIITVNVTYTYKGVAKTVTSIVERGL